MIMNYVSNKPDNGRLWRIYPGGKRELLAEDKPFPLLQLLKKQHVNGGTPKNQLKITY
jgi:hypothetical protein